MNINIYFKQLLKDKKIKVQTLISKTGASKSTIYRVMNGLQKPSDRLMDKIVEVLDLSLLESQQLHYYFSLVETDNNLVSAREEVSKLLFNIKEQDSEKFELVFYESDRYIKSFQDIIDELIGTSKEKDFSCRIRLINCNQDRILSPLHRAVSQLNESHALYSIEHLVNFSTSDFQENIAILNHLIPLLALDNYSVMYRDSANVSNYGFFHNLLIINYIHQNESGTLTKKYMVLTFLPDTLSSCYVVDTENMHSFFERNYEALLKDYRLALNTQKFFEDYGMLFLQYEMNHNLYLFKPSICYNRVPHSVWRSVVTRYPINDFLQSFLSTNYRPENHDNHLEEILLYMETRIKASYLHKQIDIMTTKGMEDFAATGLLLDHLEGLPPFNKEEIKSILQYIKARDLDTEDRYKLNLLEQDYNSETLTVVVAANRGLFVEYASRNGDGYVAPYCLIEHKEISNIFVDYAENYVPVMLALPQDKAHDFIDYLIEKYCNVDK